MFFDRIDICSIPHQFLTKNINYNKSLVLKNRVFTNQEIKGKCYLVPILLLKFLLEINYGGSSTA